MVDVVTLKTSSVHGVFQRAEWRLSGSFGVYRRVRLLADAHSTRQVSSLLDLE